MVLSSVTQERSSLKTASSLLIDIGLSFDELVSHLKVQFLLLPDTRRGSNTQYHIQDAAMSAFSVFFTQSPSFLGYQRSMQEEKGKNNVSSLFKVSNIPSDNHIRNLLDPIPPKHLVPAYNFVYTSLVKIGLIEEYRCLNNTLLIALDGVCYHSSGEVSCDKCHTAKHKNGKTTYTHSAITPVIVKPGCSHVIPLPPEFITPQDGHDKQDSEHAASKRWLKEHAQTYAAMGVTFLGDDLYDCQPICMAMLEEKCHFILTCKPDSHKTLYEWVDGLDKINQVKTYIQKRRHGKKHFTDTYRFVSKAPLRDSDDALLVNWFELITTDGDGKIIYKNAFVTDHEVTEANICQMVEAGRSRWKIENENNNVLKTKGYNLQHNFGHGKQYLSQTLLSMNILSFLYHTVLHLTDVAYKKIREKLPTRKTFFDDLRALTRYIYFDGWREIMNFMAEGLKIELYSTA